MEKYNAATYMALSIAEQDNIEQIVIFGKVNRTKNIEGEKYYELQDIHTNERILISEELYEEAENAIYRKLEDAIKSENTEDMLKTLDIILKTGRSIEKLKKTMRMMSPLRIANVYILYRDEIKKVGINISEYISMETLYEELDRIYIMFLAEKNIENAQILFETLEKCKEEIEENIKNKGGLKAYVNEKKKKRKNTRNLYLKMKIFDEILDENCELEETKEKIKMLMDLGFNKRDIVYFVEKGKMTPQRLEKAYSIPELKPRIIESIGELELENSLITFMILKGDKGISSKIKWNLLTFDRLLKMANMDNIFEPYFISVLIMEKYRMTGEKLSKEEIDMILKQKDDVLEYIRPYFELIKEGLYEEDEIIDLFYEQSEIFNEKLTAVKEKNEEVGFEFVEVKEDTEIIIKGEARVLTQTELLEYFNSEKIIEKMKNYNSKKDIEKYRAKARFIKFYGYLLKSERVARENNVKEILKDLRERLEFGVSNGKKEELQVAIDLYQNGILDNIEEIITEESEAMIFDLYGDGIDDKTIINLYEAGVVSEDIISMIYEEELERESIKEKIKENKMRTSDVVTLFIAGIIGIDELKQVEKEIDWVDIIKSKKEKGLNINISELYLKEIIGFEDINRLKEEGIIGAAQATAILEQLDLETILQNGLKSEEVDGEETGQTKSGKRPKKKKEQLPIEDREVLLEALGFEATKNNKGDILVIAKGSFEGYRVYKEVEEKYGVLIFEKDGEGSSFIMHKAKAAEFIKKSGDKATLVGRRRDWREESRTSGNVKARLHSKMWGENIIDTIVEVGSTFMFDKNEEKAKYVKEESKRLKEENKDITEYLVEVKEEEKNK